MDEESSTERKPWQVYSFAKINLFRLRVNESREGFCRRGRGRSFHVDGPKTEKAREPTVGSLVRGIKDQSDLGGIHRIKLNGTDDLGWNRIKLNGPNDLGWNREKQT